jgi:hypothetical protein
MNIRQSRYQCIPIYGRYEGFARLWIVSFIVLSATLLSVIVQAAEPVCAEVKIEISQELTLERQAFDGFMRIDDGDGSNTVCGVGARCESA